MAEATRSPVEFSITAFGGPATPEGDWTPAVRTALSKLKSRGPIRLTFPKGEYHFHPDFAAERFLFISNNDEGLKRIAFPLIDIADLEIDGHGSTFIFHGFITPFALIRAGRVALRHLTIDWARPFHSEGEILSIRPDGVDVRFAAQYPYHIKNQRLTFTGEGSDTYAIGNILEFDPARRETASMAQDNYGAADRMTALDLGERRVRLTFNFSTPPSVGNVLVFQTGERPCPAIVIDDSSDIQLLDLTLHHSGGMGVIAQWSDNITLERMRVTPPPDGGRIISLTADATHFVNCAGSIAITDCLFENQMDDAINVHGIYAQVSAIDEAAGSVLVKLKHYQQLGIDVARAGDRVEFVRHDTLLTFAEAVVQSAEWVNNEYVKLTFATPYPIGARLGDCVGNLSRQANLFVIGCKSRGNRARGFLISTAGKVEIERNTFHTPGAAILIAGDANYWFESGAVRDVTIRNNTFDACNFGVWGRALIDIHPEILPEHRSPAAYHRGITIEDNLIYAFDRRLLRAESVDGLVFRNNQVFASTEYPEQHASALVLKTEACVNTFIEEPVFQSPVIERTPLRREPISV